MNHYVIWESDRLEIIAALEATGKNNRLVNVVKLLQPVQPSHTRELSDAEISDIASDITLYYDYSTSSCQAEYLDPHKFHSAIITAINAKK